jgi:hypothetical protein
MRRRKSRREYIGFLLRADQGVRKSDFVKRDIIPWEACSSPLASRRAAQRSLLWRLVGEWIEGLDYLECVQTVGATAAKPRLRPKIPSLLLHPEHLSVDHSPSLVRQYVGQPLDCVDLVFVEPPFTKHDHDTDDFFMLIQDRRGAIGDNMFCLVTSYEDGVVC